MYFGVKFVFMRMCCYDYEEVWWVLMGGIFGCFEGGIEVGRVIDVNEGVN